MKRLIGLLFVLAFALSVVSAQVEVKPGETYKPNLESGMSTAYKALTDSLDAQEIVFNLSEKQGLYFYSIAIDIDTVDINGALTEIAAICTLQKSYDNATWSTVATVNYYAEADTFFIHQDVSTGLDAPFLKVRNVCNQDSTSLNLISIDAKFANKTLR
jgi:hypothetical protein